MPEIAKLLVLTALCPAAAISNASLAQTADTPSPDNSAGIAEIIVTANRREERLQDVPISIAAFGESALGGANVSGVSDLGKLVPTLKIGSASGTAVVFLRGVGNKSAGVGNEASVGVYIDGVYYSRLPPAFFEFNSVQRVEVLKGPQGTLFGRNSTGGVIQIITRDPSQNTEVSADIGFGSFDTVKANLYATTGFGENLSGDIALRYFNQTDGWGTNIDTGEKAYFSRDLALRSKWIFEPSHRSKATFTVDYVKSTYNSIFDAASRYEGTIGRHPLPPHDVLPSGGFYDTSGTPELGFAKSWGTTLKLEHGMDWAHLVSISAYRDTKGDGSFDVDRTPVDFFQSARQPYDVSQFTQELQLLSNPGSRFQWILGGYYLYNKSAYHDLELSGPGVGGTLTVNSAQTINSYSAYGQGTLEIGGGTSLTLGGRFTKDKLEAGGQSDFAIPGVGAFPGAFTEARTTFNKFTWKGAIDHKFSDDVLVFASVSRGFKGGIFNLFPFSTTPALPEVVDAYEAGMKTTLFGNRVRLNAAVFRYDVKNPQVDIVLAGGLALINAKKAKATGVDIDGDLLIAEGLRARFAVSYLDSKYTDFLNAPIYRPSPFPLAGTPASIADPVSGSANGNRTPQSPQWTGSIGLSYEKPLSFGVLSLNASYSYSGRYYFYADNVLAQDDFGLVDAKIGLETLDRRLRVEVWGKNLTRSKYYIGAAEVGQYYGFFGRPGEPRTVGVTIGFRYD